MIRVLYSIDPQGSGGYVVFKVIDRRRIPVGGWRRTRKDARITIARDIYNTYMTPTQSYLVSIIDGTVLKVKQ